MPIRAERRRSGWYQPCAICAGTLLTMDPQAVLVAHTDERVGWVCPDCLRRSADNVRIQVRRTAAWHRRQAALLEDLSAGPIDRDQDWADLVAALDDEGIDPDREAYEAARP